MINQILDHKRKEVKFSKISKSLAQLEREANKVRGNQGNIRDFKNSIIKNGFSLIGEIKRKSPSQGEIRKDLNPADVARIYDQCGQVACLSVLTDFKFFGGSLDDLETVRAQTSKPLLRKEFIIDEYQLFEAKVNGADAVLLISTILDKIMLKDYIQISHSLKLEPLIECHSEKDIDKIPFDEVNVVGINSRDLVGDLKTDLAVVAKLKPLIPSEKVIIAESGIHTSSELKRVYDLGADGVLIGAGILTKSDIFASIQDLFSLIPLPR